MLWSRHGGKKASMVLATASTTEVHRLGVQNMRTFLTVLVVLAASCSLHGDTIVFQENFDEAGTTVGTAVDGWNGWSLTNGSTGQIAISNNALDQGQSAAWSSSGWPQVAKGFSYSPAAGEQYVLMATMVAPATDGTAYSDLRIKNSTNGNFLQIALGYKDLLFGNGTKDVRTLQPTTITDVKMVVTDTSLTGYYRQHGVSAWTSVGSLALSTGYELSGYNKIWQVGQGVGGVDSIQLTATSVPEPSIVALIGTGVFGLLAYAWRKRR